MTADLRALRDQVASLQVTRCRMIHERIRVENGPAPRLGRGTALVRVGLCSPEVRARNLACGHTMARYTLLDAVRALHAAGRIADATFEALAVALENVTNAIHLLDHRKGDAEKELALASGPLYAAEVWRLEEEHDRFAEQIGELRTTVLAHLDAAIA